jgi:putative DNA methylase
MEPAHSETGDCRVEPPASILVARLSMSTRQLAYRLYTLCERAGWAEDARAYNEIITSWSAIESAATRAPGPQQGVLFGS